eukprot:366546-Chlamydomonas_euryale.AAC.50
MKISHGPSVKPSVKRADGYRQHVMLWKPTRVKGQCLHRLFVTLWFGTTSCVLGVQRPGPMPIVLNEWPGLQPGILKEA